MSRDIALSVVTALTDEHQRDIDAGRTDVYLDETASLFYTVQVTTGIGEDDTRKFSVVVMEVGRG